MSKKKDIIEVEGTVVEPLPNAMFRVELNCCVKKGEEDDKKGIQDGV